MSAPRLWPLYVGGFMGPFGGAMVSSMLPELASGLHTSVQAAGTAVTWYMIPFSALMLVSGTIGARFGLARSIRVAFVVYAVASLVCVVAGTAVPFLAGRGLQGAANAFTTPLLLALIAELVPPERLGHAFGTFAAMGAAGQGFAPLVGGVAAGIDYRWAFGASAVVALGLAVASPTGRRGRLAQPPAWREMANSQLVRACVSGFAAQFTATAVMLVAALVASDRFGLTPAQRGLVVAAYGLAGFLLGRPFGKLTDRIGLLPAGIGALLLLGLAVILVSASPFLAVLVLGVALAGATATGARVLTNGLAVGSSTTNPAGATSIALAVSFLGSAITPALLHLYAAHPRLTGLVPLLACFAAAAVVFGARSSARAHS